MLAASCDERLESDPVPIRGGERLAWSQMADSFAVAQALSFTLYVDGAASTLVNPACADVGVAGLYECSGGLPPMSPGPHVLQLTSRAAGAESPLSRPIVVVMTGAGTATLSSTSPANAERPTDAASAPVCGTAGSCYGVRDVATGLQTVTALAAAPDGPLFVVEEGARIRIVDNGAPGEPALILRDPQSRIVGVAADPNFATSRLVFAAWTAPAVNGAVLNVTRYRALGPSLGEGATILSGIPFAAHAAPLAIDAEGLLYVAVPAEAFTSGSSGASLLNGAVLRIDRDGSTPASNGGRSQVFSYGYARPTLLAFDAASGRLWLAGRPTQSMPLSSVDLRPSERGAWPLMPTQTAVSAPLAASVTVESAAFGGNGPPRMALFLADGQLHRAAVSRDGRLGPLEPLSLGQGIPLAVASASPESWYVAASTAHGTTSILLLSTDAR